MPKVNVSGFGVVNFPDTMSQDDIKTALDSKFSKAAPLRGVLAGVEQGAGKVAEGLATAVEPRDRPVVDSTPSSTADAFAGAIPKTFSGGMPIEQTDFTPHPTNFKWVKRNPSDVQRGILASPIYQAGKVAAESVPLTPQQQASKITSAGQMVGGASQMALGPLAIPAFALQSMGDVKEDYDRIKQENPNIGHEQASEKALDTALLKGGLTATVFTALPPAVRGPLEKYVVGKFGKSALAHFLSGRVSSATENAAVMGAQTAVQQAAEGKAPDKQSANSAAAGAVMGLLLPWLKKGSYKDAKGKEAPGAGEASRQAESKIPLVRLSRDEASDTGHDAVQHIVDKHKVSWDEAVEIQKENRDHYGSSKIPLKKRPYVVAPQEETGEFHVGREDDGGVIQPEGTFDNQEDAQKKVDALNADLKKTGGKKSDVEHVLSHIEKKGGVSASSLARSKKWKIARARAALEEAEKQGLIARPDEKSPYVKVEKPAEEGAQPFSRMAEDKDRLQPGERLVTVKRPDGSTYQAAFGGKYWEFPGKGKMAAIATKNEAGWSHGVLPEGHTIQETPLSTGAGKGGKLSPHDLQPALLINGEPVTGGRTHADIAAAQIKTGDRNKLMMAMKALQDDSKHVFVDKNGRQYTRRQAADALGQKSDLHSQTLRELQEKSPLSRTTESPKALPKPLDEVLHPEMKAHFESASKRFGVDLEHVDSLDPHNRWAKLMSDNGAAATVDFDRGKVMVNTRAVSEWLRREIKPKDWKKAITSLIAQERTHLFTTPAEADAFWNSLTDVEKNYYRDLYSNGGTIDISDRDERMMGYEAINLFKQDLANMTTLEYLQMSKTQKFNSKAMKIVAGFVRRVRKILSKIPVVGKDAKAMLKMQMDIMDSIQRKIDEHEVAMKGEQPMARIARRKESKEQETFLLPGSDTIKTAAGNVRQVEQVPGEGFKFKPTEGVAAEERKVELPAKPEPPTGGELNAVAYFEAGKLFKDAIGKESPPKQKDFEEAMKKRIPEIQSGQLFELWSHLVSDRLENISDEDFRGLATSVLVPKAKAVGEVEREEGELGGIKGGGRGDSGTRNRWVSMIRSALSFTKEAGHGQGELGLTVGKGAPVASGKDVKFNEKSAQPRLKLMGYDEFEQLQKSIAKRDGKEFNKSDAEKKYKKILSDHAKERDLNAEAAVRQDKVDERTIARRRAILKNEVWKRLVIPRIETADLHRNTVELGDIRYGGGKLISAVQDIDPNAWKNSDRLGEELLDESKRHPSDPNTYTKRLTLIQDKGAGRVSLVSTYRRGGEAMLLDPHHPQKFHIPLKQMIGRYRIIQSVLLDEPVQKFRQSWDSLQDYQDEFGKDAKETNDQHTSSEGIHGLTHRQEPMSPQGQRLTEITGENEGIPGSMVDEGASGHLQGPFRSDIEIAAGSARGSMETSRRAPITPGEASALTAHIADELGKAPDSPDDVRLVLDQMKAWRRPNPSVVSALRKLAAIVEREEELRLRQHIREASKQGINIEATPLSVDYLADKLSQYIYEDQNLEKTLASAAKAQSAAPRPTSGLAAPATGRPSSARDLVNPINRRPPTDVNLEEIQKEQGFQRIIRMPLPGEGTKPNLHTLLTAPDIEHVEQQSQINNPYKPSPPVNVTPEERGLLLKNESPMARIKRRQTDSPMARIKVRASAKRNIDNAAAELDRKRRQLSGVLGRAGTVRQLKQDRDGVDNLTAVIREGTRLSLRNVVVTGDAKYDDLIRQTPIAMMAALKEGQNPTTGNRFTFYDPSVFDRLINDATVGGLKAEAIINNPKTKFGERVDAKKWKVAADKLLHIALWTKDHWKDKDVRDMSSAVRGELADQLYREHHGGVSTTDFGISYLPGLKEGELYNLDSVTFGEDPVIGNRFSSKKTFRDHYDAIRTGAFVPKSYDTAITIAHRVGSGMNAVNRNAFVEIAKGLKDAKSGMPVVMSALPIDPHQATREDTGQKEFYNHGWQSPSPNYDLVDMGKGLHPVAVLKPYARSWSLLFANSGFENSALGEGALYFSSMLKHGVVLVFDTFHPGRLGQYAMALSKPQEIPGLMRRSFGNKSGAWAALFYRPQDLDIAVKNGLVHPEAAQWAKEKIAIGNELWTKQEVLHEMVKHGLNASRIGDALYKDAVERIPIVGKYLFHGLDEPSIRSEHVPQFLRNVGLKNFNGWMFNRLLPSLISETAVRNFERLHKANPDVPVEKMMRDVITDMNTIYGNMGRQGLIANPTIRDAAQVFLLAPMWQEGLIGKEVRTLGRLTGISNLTGRRGLPQFGALGQFMGRGLAAYFVMTQLINLITKQQTTFQNEYPHELDAWIPTGQETGVWLSPMSIFGETLHDFIRLYQTNHNAWETVKHIGLNKLGPTGRAANVLWSGKSSQGEYLPTTSDVLKSAAGELAPVPISLGVPVRAMLAGVTDRVSPPEPGALQRQMFASASIKVQAQTDLIGTMKNSAMQYVKDHHLRPDSALITPTSDASYAKLRHAVKIGDYRAAGQILLKLREVHNGSDTPTLQAMSNWVSRPLTGGNESEREWLDSLTPGQIDQYRQAIRSMQDQYRAFNKWYFTVNADRYSPK